VWVGGGEGGVRELERERERKEGSRDWAVVVGWECYKYFRNAVVYSFF